MSIKFLYFFTLSLSLIIYPGVSHSIIAGSITTQFQAVGSLQSQAGACTATLIDSSWIVTHPDCLASSGDINFIVGNDYTTPDAVFTVDAFSIHPSYDSVSLSNAIGLGHLSGPVSTIDPIDVISPANDGISFGDSILHVGYGITSYPSGTNSLRRQYTSAVIDTNFGSFTTSNAFGGPCAGDLGGPGLIDVSGTVFLAGIVSFTDQECNQITVNTRISDYYDYIRDTIASGTSAVPLPAAVWLFGTALVGLIGFGKQRKVLN